jgi:dTDP-4-dehydrorhamnose reductase
VVATWHSHPVDDSTARWVRIDLADVASIDDVIAEAAPDAVVNTAYRQGPGLWPVTVDGATAVADASRRAGARLVHLSTDVIFDGRKKAPYTEDDEPRPLHDYGRAKLAAEQRVLAAHPDATLVRTSLLYGGDEPGPQERLVLSALAGSDVAFFTDEIRSPVRVNDLADAIADLLDLASPGPLHLAGADPVSRYEFACLLARAAGGSPEVLRAAPSSRRDRPLCIALDSSRAFTLLGRALPGPSGILP